MRQSRIIRVIPWCCPRGLTLTECVVLIAIITVLLGLLIPALMHSRASARKLMCANRLRAIGSALAAYGESFGMYPSAKCADDTTPAGGLSSANRISPLVRLLPYLEQGPVYELLNLERLFVEDRAYTEIVIDAYLCPADAAAVRGGTNFRVSLGPGPYYWPPIGDHAGWPEGGQGAFVLFAWLRERDFSDGLSKTVGMSERLRGDRDDRRFHSGGDSLLTGYYGPPFPNADGISDFCGALNPDATRHESVGGSSWALSGFLYTWYNHVETPNSLRSVDCSNEIRGAPSARPGGVFRATSLHGGGVNSLMMDGSVHFWADSIDRGLWRALSTRAGGEPVGF